MIVWRTRARAITVKVSSKPYLLSVLTIRAPVAAIAIGCGWCER